MPRHSTGTAAPQKPATSTLDAATNLGILLAEGGDLTGAEPWLRQAAESGDASGMNSYGVLLRMTGREAEAEAWFARVREAAVSG